MCEEDDSRLGGVRGFTEGSLSDAPPGRSADLPRPNTARGRRRRSSHPRLGYAETSPKLAPRASEGGAAHALIEQQTHERRCSSGVRGHRPPGLGPRSGSRRGTPREADRVRGSRAGPAPARECRRIQVFRPAAHDRNVPRGSTRPWRHRLGKMSRVYARSGSEVVRGATAPSRDVAARWHMASAPGWPHVMRAPGLAARLPVAIERHPCYDGWCRPSGTVPRQDRRKPA